MAKTKKNVTILVLDERSTKTLHMDVRHLNAIRPALIGLTAASLILAGVCSTLALSYYQKLKLTSQQRAENSDLQQQVVDLRQATSEEIERKVSALSKSEQSLQKLQQYLRDRGIKTKPISTAPPPLSNEPNDAAGGPELELAVTMNVPYTGTFQSDVSQLLTTVRQVPLGRPAYGSLSSRFGVRSNPFSGRGSELHSGLDFRGTTGDPIRTTADGTVVFAGTLNGYGNLIRVRHGYGYETYYAHLSAINVRVGQKVSAGDTIGKLGSTGRSTGPHLHYEVRLDNKPLDPENYLSLASGS
ncbi:MAG: peptidoglycan DD-metalloendopeptidase family protein [Neisseria sp.]|nr:peptidoglycan DD-metalloendopeptidase family protein [Neisseria sp.]